MRNFSSIAKPLTELRKKNTVFKWNSDCKESLMFFKQKLCEVPVLRCPDYSKEFLLTTDARNKGLGAILSQEGHP